MNYHSLAQLKQKFGSTFEWEQTGNYLNEYNAAELPFLKHTLLPNAIIFLGWIERMKGLEEILLNGTTNISFKDDLKVLDHSMANEFKQFVTPMLSPAILKEVAREKVGATNTYVALLDSDTRPIVEDQIYQHITPLFNDVKALLDEKVGENSLIAATQKAVNDDIIAIINSFSRQSYALKLKYVDTVLTILNARSCTLRLANWILKQLEKLTLNPEHNYKINDLRNDLKLGHFKVQNTNTRKGITIPLRTILMSVFLIGIVSFAVYVITFKPWSDPDKPEIAKNSSFTSFTKEERQQLDSLLKIIQPARALSDEELDLGTYLGEELELIVRVPFKNEIVERYYGDLETYMQNYDALRSDTCIAKSKEELAKLLPKRMTSLDQKKDGNTAYFKNESDYDVQIIVFRNFLKSAAYFGTIAQGKTTTIRLEIGDWFMVIPGKFLETFTVPANHSGELPSSDFNVKFCEIDVNFAHGINTSYTLNSTAYSNYKFLLVGSPTEQFELVDIYGVLSEQ